MNCKYVKKANIYISEENTKISEEEKKREQEKAQQNNQKEQNIEEDIIIEDEENQNDQPIRIQDFERINIEGRDTKAFKSILIAIGLRPEDWYLLSKITTNCIRNHNWGNKLTQLGYQSQDDLIDKILTLNKFINYEELAPLFIYFNIKCNIFLSDDKYRTNQWIKINDKTENDPQQEQIHLWLHQRENQEIEGYYEPLLSNKNRNPKTKKRRTAKNH